MSYNEYENEQARVGTERERRSQSEWRLEKEDIYAKVVYIFLPFFLYLFISSFLYEWLQSFIIDGCYGTVFTPLLVMSPPTSFSHFPNSLTPSVLFVSFVPVSSHILSLYSLCTSFCFSFLLYLLIIS